MNSRRSRRPLQQAMRGALGLAAILATGLSSAPAQAAPATRDAYRFVLIDCLSSVSDGGSAFFNLAISRIDTDVAVVRWAPGADPFEDEPVQHSRPTHGSAEGISWEGDVIRGVTELYDPDGASVGPATWQLTLTPSEPQPFEANSRSGNIRTRESGVEYPDVAVDGTLTLPDGETVAMSSDDCTGYGGENTIFRNSPNAVITPREYSLGGCDMRTATGGLLSMRFDVGGEVEVFITEWAPGADPVNDAPLLYGSAFAVHTATTLDATVPMFVPGEEGDVYVGDAFLDAALATGAPKTTVYHYPWGRERVQSRPLSVTGTITLPDGRTYSLTGCSGAVELTQRLVVGRGAIR